MKKIIFLDIDGVMATANDFDKSMDNPWNSYRFDSKAVVVLNSILKETGAEIILSSDWKYHYSLTEMNDIFTHNGVIKGPIGFTPSSKNYNATTLEWGRADEINMWMEMHNVKNDLKWVAVDDLNLSEFYAEKVGGTGLTNFVHCPKIMEGIKQTGVKDKILKFLQ